MRAARSVLLVWLAVLGVVVAGIVPASSAATTTTAATTSVRTIWVDPVSGRDSRSGATKATALRTLTAAWNRIPPSRRLTRPVRILVRAGVITAANAPNYWERRWGTASAPISIVSVDGPGRARLPSVNMFDVRHLTFDGVAIRSPFDAFHCERCSHLTLTRSAFAGIGDPAADEGPQEAVKINQSDHVRIVDSYLAGATDNALDLVAVQHAYVARNTIAHATDWCAYAKGGSTGVVFEGNDVHHCGTGGIALGQGTGLQFMVPPWTNYEVYGSRAVNNVVHDVEGAALAVNGGFAVLLAHNTAYRIGSRDHLLAVAFGERSCDGEGEGDAACAAARDAGGWGPRAGGTDPTPVGNSQVAVLHNLLVNPADTVSQWTHLAVYAPRDAPDSGGPDPAVADDGLVIRGNAIWNGPPDHDLGLGGEQGCRDDHPTCAPDAVRAANAVNVAEPAVQVVAGAVPVPTGEIAAGTGAGSPLPAFTWTGVAADRGVPPVTMPAAVTVDRAGLTREGRPWRPGAYAGDAPTSGVTATVTGRGTVTARTSAVLGTAPVTVLRGGWLEVTARGADGHRLLGWGGACAGQRTATCLVRAATAEVTVTARFG